MRVKFIETNRRIEAIKAAMWASKIVKVEGGYMAFESWDDYNTWKNQR